MPLPSEQGQYGAEGEVDTKTDKGPSILHRIAPNRTRAFWVGIILGAVTTGVTLWVTRKRWAK